MMLRELAHFGRYAPEALVTRRRVGKVAFFDLFEKRMDEAGKAQWREALVAGLEGDVLEVGSGTGMMFPFYGAAVRLTAIEPDEAFLAVSVERARSARARIETRMASGESLPFPDASFDAAVFAGVLCSVRSVESTLSEVARVLKPGGTLCLLEHIKSDRPLAGFLAHVFNPVWLVLNQQGCNMDRDPKPALRAAGFTIDEVKPFQIFAPGVPPAFLYELIRATRRDSVS